MISASFQISISLVQALSGVSWKQMPEQLGRQAEKIVRQVMLAIASLTAEQASPTLHQKDG
jgi:hypothetical protein